MPENSPTIESTASLTGDKKWTVLVPFAPALASEHIQKSTTSAGFKVSTVNTQELIVTAGSLIIKCSFISAEDQTTIRIKTSFDWLYPWQLNGLAIACALFLVVSLALGLTLVQHLDKVAMIPLIAAGIQSRISMNKREKDIERFKECIQKSLEQCKQDSLKDLS